MDENRRKLYDQLSQNWNVGSWEEFDRDIDNEDNMRVAWDAVGGQDGYGDFDLFKQSIQRSPQQEEQPQQEVQQPAQQDIQTQVPTDEPKVETLPAVEVTPEEKQDVPPVDVAPNTDAVETPDAVETSAEVTATPDATPQPDVTPAVDYTAMTDADAIKSIDSIEDADARRNEALVYSNQRVQKNKSELASKRSQTVSVPQARAEELGENYAKLFQQVPDGEGNTSSVAQRAISKYYDEYNDNIVKVRSWSDEQLRNAFAEVMQSNTYRSDEERAVAAIPMIEEMNARASNSHAMTMGEREAEDYLSKHPELRANYEKWRNSEEGFNSHKTDEATPFVLSDMVMQEIDSNIKKAAALDERRRPNSMFTDPVTDRSFDVARGIDMSQAMNVTDALRNVKRIYGSDNYESYVVAFAARHNMSVDAARQRVDQLVYLTVGERMKELLEPKNSVEYFLRKALYDNYAANIGRALYNMATSKPGDVTVWSLEEQSMQGFEQKNLRSLGGQAVIVGATLTSFANDMLGGGFTPAAIAGGVAGRATARLLGKDAATVFWKRLTTGGASGAFNFAVFDTQCELLRQLRTGDYSGYNLTKSFFGGMEKGAAFGVVGESIGRLFWNSRGWMVPVGEAVKLVGEAATFSTIGYLETGQLTAKDWATNFGMALSGRLHHASEYIADVRSRMKNGRVHKIDANERAALTKKGYGNIADVLHNGKLNKSQLDVLESELETMRNDKSVSWETIRLAEFALNGRLLPAPPMTDFKAERDADDNWVFTPWDKDGDRAIGGSVTVKGTEAKNKLQAELSHQCEKNAFILNEAASGRASVQRAIGKAVISWCDETPGYSASSAYKLYTDAVEKINGGEKLGDFEKEVFDGVNKKMKGIEVPDDVADYKKAMRDEGYDLDKILAKPNNQRSTQERAALERYKTWLDGRDADVRNANESDFYAWMERNAIQVGHEDAKVVDEVKDETDEKGENQADETNVRPEEPEVSEDVAETEGELVEAAPETPEAEKPEEPEPPTDDTPTDTPPTGGGEPVVEGEGESGAIDTRSELPIVEAENLAGGKAVDTHDIEQLWPNDFGGLTEEELPTYLEVAEESRKQAHDYADGKTDVKPDQQYWEYWAERDKLVEPKAEVEQPPVEQPKQPTEAPVETPVEQEPTAEPPVAQPEVEQPTNTAPLSNETNEFGKPFVLSSDGTTTMGEITEDTGLTPAPIKLSQGENTVDAEGINHGYGLLHIEATRGDQIRAAGFNSIEEFVESVAKNYDTIREGNVVADNQTYLLEVSDEHNNTLFIQLSRDGSYWNVNSAGIFRTRYSRNKPKVHTRPALEPETSTDSSGVNHGQTEGATVTSGNSPRTSDGKGSENISNDQINGEKNAELAQKNVEVTSEGQRRNAEEAAKKRAQAADPYYMPMENKGGGRMSPDYDKASAEQIFNHLNDRENREQRGTLSADIEKRLKDAQTRLASIEKQEPKGNNRTTSALNAWERRRDAAADRVEKWKEVKRMHDENQRTNGKSELDDRQARELFFSIDPAEGGSLRDYVMRQLYGMKFKWKGTNYERSGGRTSGLGGHLGLENSEKERRGFFGWLDEKNGMTPEEAAHSIWESMPQEWSDRYDTMEILDEVLSVVGDFPRPMDMVRDFAKNHRSMADEQADWDAGQMGYKDAAEAEADMEQQERDMASRHDAQAAENAANEETADKIAELQHIANDPNRSEFERQAARSALRWRQLPDAERKRRTPLIERVKKWTRKIGGNGVVVLHGIDEIQDGYTRRMVEQAHANGQRTPGWYDKGKVYIFMPDVTDRRDVDKTMVHEVVSHKGIKGLLGEAAYNDLLDAVYASMSIEAKDEYSHYIGGKENETEVEHHRRMADEWIANNLEGTRVDNKFAEAWNNIAKYVLDTLRGWGFDISNITKTDLEHLLRESYKKLRGDAGGRDGAPARLTDGGDGVRFRFTEDKEDFDRMQKEAVEKKGMVMPSLAEKEVKVVHGDINHPFDTSLPDTSLKKQVKSYAREHSDEMLGDVPVENGIVNVSLTSLGEMADPKSYKNTVKNGVSKDVHFAAIPKIKEIIRNSIDAEVHPDYIERDKSGKRIVGKYSDHILMHRLYGAVEIDGKVYRVKTTVKEDITNKTNRAHTYEVAEIELLESHTRPADSTSPISNNSISGANLLQGVEKSYDSGKKLLDESAKTTDSGSRDAEYAAAVAAGDAEKVDRMLREEAGRKGYHAQEDYHDAHYAPYASVERGKFTDVDALREAVEVNGDDPNLFAIANGISNQPDDYWSQRGPRLYMYNDQAGYETYAEIGAAIRGIQYQLRTYGEVRDMPWVKVYRAVPEDIKGEQLETYGQWVSPSRTYAEKHGKHRFGEGAYRIIEQEVPADQLWWDGNDAREWGYDDGSRADVYKNTANNRKLLEATYDDAGNLIPLSQRFDEGKSDVRFRVRDAERKPTFYSNAERAVEGVKQEKATGEQWKAMLTKAGGIKAGEDKWMGLSQWLDDHKGEKLTKDEVLQFVRDNGVRMEEFGYTEHPKGFDDLKREYDQWLRTEGFDYAQEQLRERFGDDADIAFDDLGGELVISNEEAAAALLGSEQPINSTRLDYTTEGLENKREIAFLVPGVEPYQKNDAVHFGPENEGRAVMWVRFGETTDKDGNRVLVIDEIQSNRHQNAREKGYKGHGSEYERLKQQAQNTQDAYFEQIEEYARTADGRLDRTKLNRAKEDDPLSKALWEQWSKDERALRQYNESHGFSESSAIPAAPFEKNWHEVAMKRMLRLAADEGFDKVAWTTGEQQAERYGIGGVVEGITKGKTRGENTLVSVQYKNGKHDSWVVAPDGKVVDGGITTGENLSDLIGKELSEKVMSLDENGSISGDGLRIGGEGMKGFYDQMLPSFMNKYGKRWGTQVGEVELNTPGHEVMHSVDVTDAMKESVQQGQPLFRVKDEEQTRSENFKAWFGDWENDPRNASKVVDENGEPLVVYHGDKSKERYEYGPNTFFTPSEDYAKRYTQGTGDVKDYYLDIKHPFDIRDERSRAIFTKYRNGHEPAKTKSGAMDWAEYDYDDLQEYLEQNYPGEFDGFVLDEGGDGGYGEQVKDRGLSYVPFSPGQVKSATENNGEFSRENPDVRFRTRDDEHRDMVDDAKRRLDDPNASEFEKTAARTVLRAYGGGDTPDGGNTVEDSGVRYRIKDDAERMTGEVVYKNRQARQRKEAVADFVKATADLDEMTDSKFATALGKVMRGQREYDKDTVKDITDMAKAMMDAGLLSGLDDFAVKQILTKVKDATGKEGVTKEANKLIDIMLKHQLKKGKSEFEQSLKAKGMKQDSRGVVVQGGLDYHGQRMVKSLKEALGLSDLQAVNDRIVEVEQKLNDPDEVVRGNAADELDGLYIARQYFDEIKQNEINEANVKTQLEEAKNRHKNGDMSDAAYHQFVWSCEDALRELRCERVDAWSRLNGQLGDSKSESAERAKVFRDEQNRRKEEIQHWANSDMEGHSADPHEQETRKKSAGDKMRDVAQAVLQPLGTFDKLMRYFGNAHPKGEGYLFGFMRRFMNVRDQWFKERKADFDQMDAAARRIGAAHGALVKVTVAGGKIATRSIKDWADVYTYINQQKPLTVTVKGKDYEITQGNAAYLLAMEGQADGRMKLRSMGLTEADMDALRGQVDPMLLELSQWVIHGLLPGMRPRLNATHIRMFGADMTDVPNYFPIRTSELARNETVNLAQQNGKIRPATITGSIIERKRNNLDLDLGADFFQVTAEHIDEMNHWNSFAEFARDLNTLLSYKRFKAQVHNLHSWRYGNGADIWKTLEDTAAITTGDYQPKTSKADTIINGAAKGLAAANITFRPYTGLKQLLSAPVYLVQARWDDIGYAIANLKGTWQWAIKNLPTFAERWQGRMAGEPILTQAEQERGSQNKKLRWLSKAGFAFNAGVDAVTVAIGARAIYRTKYRRYKDMGYSDEQANQKALEDAAISVNETQQSGLGAFTSVIQQDRTFWSRALTIYRNASMGYQRQLAEGLKAMRNGVSAEWRATAKEKVAKKLERDGIDPAMAAKVADRLANREAMRGLALAAMFGSIAPFVWALGKQYLGYKMAGGDDDEQEDKMLGQASTHLLSGWVEGIVFGGQLSSAADFAYDYYHGRKKLRDYSLQRDLVSDMAEQILGKSSGKPADAVYDIVNMIVAMSTGVNPKSIVEPTVGIIDVVQNWGGDAKLAHEVALGWCRLLNVPQTSLDQVYVDEIGLSAKDAKQLSAEEFAERWCRYKRRRGAGWMSALTSDESDKEQEGKLLKRYERMMDERFESLSDERIEQIMESDDELLKKHAAKAYKSRIDALTDDEVAAAVVPLSDSAPQDSVDVKREGIKRAYKSEGVSYSKPSDDSKNALAYEHHATYDDITEDAALKGRKDALKKSVGEKFEKMGVKYKNGSAGWDWYADDDASASIDEIKAYYQSHKAELDEYGILSWWFGTGKGSSGYIKKGFSSKDKSADEVMKEYRDTREQVLSRTKRR